MDQNLFFRWLIEQRSLFRTLGVPIALMAFFHISPEWLLDPDLLPFVWDKIVVAVTVIVALGSFFLTFIIAFGFLEFAGIIMQPILRPLYKVPGKAAIDAVASFVGSFSVAIYLTDKLYNAKIYTNREASIIITGFSTVSTTFMIVVAKTAGFMGILNFYFFSTLVVTFTVTAIVVRMWPISRIDASYRDGEKKPEEDLPGSLFLNAVKTGLKRASETQSIHKSLWENLKGGIAMCFTLSPCIASIALIAFILVQRTSVFDIFGLVFAPFTSKCVVAVVSVSAILFFGGSIPCIFATNIKIKTWQILVIWFERTVLSIMLAGIVAIIMF